MGQRFLQFSESPERMKAEQNFDKTLLDDPVRIERKIGLDNFSKFSTEKNIFF